MRSIAEGNTGRRFCAASAAGMILALAMILPTPLWPDSNLAEDSGREERMLLSAGSADYATEVIVMQGAEEGKVALLMGGAHGNEPGGYWALLEFVETYRPKNGTLVVLPLQNPLARRNNTRSSKGPILNNYYNFSRAFPALNAVPEREQWIRSQFRGVNDTWWWYGGDQKLTEEGVISWEERKAATLEGLLDEEGCRRALDPEIKQAAKNVYGLMIGRFPDGKQRYDQIDLLLDLHEAAWFYQDVLCADDAESLQFLDDVLPDINQRLEELGLDPVSVLLTPVPTSPGWAAHYELPRPAIAVTTETNRRLEKERRLAAQRIFLKAILESFGFELEKVEKPPAVEPAG